MNPIWLPEGLRPLQTQVAGHTFQADTNAIGMLQDSSNASCVLKPLGKPECAERELAFYETLRKTDDPVLKKLLPLVPQYYEHVKLHINQKDMDFLKLENITYGMDKPCIMDIKVGRRTWDPNASPKKRSVEEKKYIHSKQILGLCIPGFQVYEAEKGLLLRHSKEYGKKLDFAGFKHAMRLFLNLQGTQHDRCLVNEVLRQLYDIRNWFSLNTEWHFYASSLLIAYDFEPWRRHDCDCHTNNNTLNGNDPRPAKMPRQWVKVRMIDFAHVFPSEYGTLDANYCFGLQNLITILEEFSA